MLIVPYALKPRTFQRAHTGLYKLDENMKKLYLAPLPIPTEWGIISLLEIPTRESTFQTIVPACYGRLLEFALAGFYIALLNVYPRAD